VKICEAHLEKVKQAIKSHGLWDFVSEDAEEYLKREKALIKGGKLSVKNFDPLGVMTGAIALNAVLWGGLKLALSDGCPLCEVEDDADHWIEQSVGVAETLLEAAKRYEETDCKQKK